MSIDIKIKKGLDIPMTGEAAYAVETWPRPKLFAVKPSDFVGVNPRLDVEPGAKVKVGDVLFHSKYQPEVKFTSPVSGTVKAVERGKRRVILRVVIEADKEDEYKEFNPSDTSRENIVEALLESGLFPFFEQRPYNIVPSLNDVPKAIYIRAYDNNPLSVDYAFALENRKEDLQKGIRILNKLTGGKVYMINDGESQTFLNTMKDVEHIRVSGPYPSSNPSVAIAHTNPISQEDRLWVIDAWDVAGIGSFFETGRINPEKIVAFTGNMLDSPKYYRIRRGANVKEHIGQLLKKKEGIRIISGNPLTGTNITDEGFLGSFDNSVSVLEEGDKARFFGWLPFFGTSRKTVYRLDFDWFSNKKKDYDTSLHGEERPFVMTEEIEEVMPLDIYPVHLLKACLTGDVDKMEQLGILEVAPEDFALVDYISSSKINAQNIIRNGLNIMMVEIG